VVASDSAVAFSLATSSAARKPLSAKIVFFYVVWFVLFYIYLLISGSLDDMP